MNLCQHTWLTMNWSGGLGMRSVAELALEWGTGNEVNSRAGSGVGDRE